jgi:hypothetical protein
MGNSRTVVVVCCFNTCAVLEQHVRHPGVRCLSCSAVFGVQSLASVQLQTSLQDCISIMRMQEPLPRVAIVMWQCRCSDGLRCTYLAFPPHRSTSMSTKCCASILSGAEKASNFVAMFCAFELWDRRRDAAASVIACGVTQLDVGRPIALQTQPKTYTVIKHQF